MRCWRAAGAGKGQFYHYFRGRDELAAAAVGFRCGQVIAGLTQALGAVSSLAGLEQALAGFAAGFEQPGSTPGRGCWPVSKGGWCSARAAMT
jgi:AcrR family transcriptional regulator